MSWAAIVGQPLAVRLFQKAVTTDSLSHAYLLVGPDGVGKRTVAMELARVLACAHPTPEGACGVCSGCVKLAASPPTHPDLIVIQPDGRMIKTDQMRALQTEMYVRPGEARFRVAMIDGADKLNAEAGNRVLKLLEEPPEYAVFLLLAENLASVLPTIVSRCQVVHLPPLSLEDVTTAVQRQLGLDAQQARLFAGLSGGSIGRAVAMAQNPEVAERRDATHALIDKIDGMDDFALLGYSETLEKQKDEIDPWLDMLLLWLRDGFVMAQAGVERLIMNGDRLPAVRSLANRYGAEGLAAMIDVVSETRGRLQRNANFRLALDLMLIRLGEIARNAGRL